MDVRLDRLALYSMALQELRKEMGAAPRVLKLRFPRVNRDGISASCQI
jgi:hypothetical protein